MAKDPVCGMTIEEEKARHILYTAQGTLYFCSEACRESYSAHNVNCAKHTKGGFRRLLEKIARGNEESYGGQPPKCH
jgi:YHS domain-containing protein